MADYFSEYSAFIGAKVLPSPADTPYETPGYIRSKRSSRVGSLREPSHSPPPLPPDAADHADRSREGRMSSLDPRRFTPTLHASLVSEILSLKREVEAKNALVESLETSLAGSKAENEVLVEEQALQAKDVRKAKQQLDQMEKGTYDAVAGVAQERDEARAAAEELRLKLEKSHKQTRRQDDDAVKTQEIWEREKETWDNERRQLERRVHVTETRLRALVDEMSAQQASKELQHVRIETPDDKTFKDSGVASESDTASISQSPVKTSKHHRNMSSMSFRSVRSSTSNRSFRQSRSNSRMGAATPDHVTRMNGFSLADELGIDEEDAYDIDEFENADDELDDHERARRTMESRQSSVGNELDFKAKKVLGLTTDVSISPVKTEFPKDSLDQVNTSLPPVAEVASIAAEFEYVDRGCQPSPPPSPSSTKTEVDAIPISLLRGYEPQASVGAEQTAIAIRSTSDAQTQTVVQDLQLYQPDVDNTPVVLDTQVQVDQLESARKLPYTTAATQTEIAPPERPRSSQSKRESLQLPMFVPSIAIHPPTSRPSSPRPPVLPPGTKNASTQATFSWQGTDACVQTEEIRVDKRPVKLPPHLLPAYLLPSPNLDTAPVPQDKGKNRASGGIAKILTKLPPAEQLPSPPVQSPTSDSSPDYSRRGSTTDHRSRPLRAIPLPRPVLAPLSPESSVAPHGKTDGPLNRASQYGVNKSAQTVSQLADIDNESDVSDYEDPVSDADLRDITGSIPSISRAGPPQGRFGLSEPPKVVPEDKEISPERRPTSSGSAFAAPAPSVSSSRATSNRTSTKPATKLNTYRNWHSRSPSFASMASSMTSNQSALPPYPIPTRSSSRVVQQAHSEGSASPTPFPSDPYAPGPSRPRHGRIASREKPNLRKVQSAAAIRGKTARVSPQKVKRRRRASPDLTPVQSMAFDSPAPTKFPIPDLPTPLANGPSHSYMDSQSSSRAIGTASSSIVPSTSNETALVDAIAATMVGEWMLKYIRKRKSFGIQEGSPDYVKAAGQDGTVDITGSGSRHKRWVWLSPYERTIMWDTRQPTSGAALLGKKGRKLPIQSVLDVQDNTPLPKGSDIGAAFNRSILILTPQRALKFTAVSQERHDLWMTALTFLARTSPASELPPMPIMPPVPAVPREQPSPLRRARAPSFGRASIRDSVRLAKGDRPKLPRGPSYNNSAEDEMFLDPSDLLQDTGADFPAIPRLYSNTTRHQRKRSNTSPRLPAPLGGFRSFSSSAALPTSASSSRGFVPSSTGTYKQSALSGSSYSGHGGGGAGGGVSGGGGGGSNSRPASLQSPQQANFFEAVQSTVRMEAFVDPSVRDGVLYVPAPLPPAAGIRRRQRGDSNVSIATNDRRRAGYVFDENGFDPFKGF
ncbi:hypothetical protein K431DRAFT_318412 [Polychaeton citri CBS 116435]|uniref:Pleckstrin homology domain-containing protein n=1 Tax=Polychaeton citri CBS 116435 TaxID=1314669 RepID=A0A9P4UT22_9PEZI|nr:hypothetical protein K431DRAFT_318412 [Polychaeton citri CBS 116435]